MSQRAVQQALVRIGERKMELGVIPKKMQQKIQFMDYRIRKQLKSFTLLALCGADRGNFMVDSEFQKAFNELSSQQKVKYYAKYVDTALKVGESVRNKKQTEGNIQTITNTTFQIKVLVKGQKQYEQTEIKIQNMRAICKGKFHLNVELANYLIRKSKKKDYFCYVLQSIRYSDPPCLRFAFLSAADETKYYDIILSCIDQGIRQEISTQMSDLLRKSKPQSQINQNNPSRQFKLKSDRDYFQNQQKVARNQSTLSLAKSVIEDIVKQRDQQQLDEGLEDLIDQQNQAMQQIQKSKKKGKISSHPKYNKNIFKIILPYYSLKNIQNMFHYGSIYESQNTHLYIYQNAKETSEYKMQFTLNIPLHVVCRAIYNVQLYKNWNPEVGEGQIKLKISSENSCIMYIKIKAFSEWYKERDYLLLAHMFRIGNAYYIVQKSIENAHYIPFQSITRGNFVHSIWKIQQDEANKSKQIKVTLDLKVDHNGLLNKNHQKQLTLRYLKGFEHLQSYFKNNQNVKKLTDIMGFQWVISQTQSQNYQKTSIQEPSPQVQFTNNFETQDVNSQIQQSQQTFYSIEDDEVSPHKGVIDFEQEEKEDDQKSEHEIDPEKQKDGMAHSQFVNKLQVEQINTNEDGIIVLPSKYLKKRHQIQPFQTERKVIEMPYENIIAKNDWEIQKCGGIRLINQKKIDAQNNVLKFIMKTLKKNLFSGKGVLSISLPVQIFNIDSNLQRTCLSMSLGPEFLQKAAKSTDHIQRFKQVLAFGLSNTIIYFDVQKPFNPILGETYQGFIRGCPIYAEQISHHPPITSVLFYGRGYKIHASLQAKVNIHMNSGDGINQGFYHVIFDDGQQIIFQTPAGELSGLAMGDRRFNVKGRGQYLDVKNNIFCEMKVQNSGGLFGKKKQFIDEIQGEIIKVKDEFVRKFMNAQVDKKPSPSRSDIVQKISELSGRWPFAFKIEEKVYYDVVKDLPDKMIDDIYPLNSNSNYREDLFYRKKDDLSRSQIQKQRLEVFQRGDRKLREKFHGSKH